MTKGKSKNSNSVNDKNIDPYADYSINDIIIDWFKYPTLHISQRIGTCIKAIQEYGDISSDLEIIEENIKYINDLVKSSKVNQINTKKTENKLYRAIVGEKEFTAKNIFDSVVNNYREANICESQSLTILANCCSLLPMLERDEIGMTAKDVLLSKKLEKLVLMKSAEALGYWTAKLEIMKQNKSNVEIRTSKKESRKAELKEWLTTMKPKECRRKAQQKWDVSERTVLKWLQEIRDEETSIMRKKDVDTQKRC